MDKQDQMYAQLLAMRAAVLALTAITPDKAVALEKFEEAVNVIMAVVLPADVSQEFVDAVESALSQYRARLTPEIPHSGA